MRRPISFVKQDSAHNNTVTVLPVLYRPARVVLTLRKATALECEAKNQITMKCNAATKPMKNLRLAQYETNMIEVDLLLQFKWSVANEMMEL
jgi:hypothetical protein